MVDLVILRRMLFQEGFERVALLIVRRILSKTFIKYRVAILNCPQELAEDIYYILAGYHSPVFAEACR